MLRARACRGKQRASHTVEWTFETFRLAIGGIFAQPHFETKSSGSAKSRPSCYTLGYIKATPTAVRARRAF